MASFQENTIAQEHVSFPRLLFLKRLSRDTKIGLALLVALFVYFLLTSSGNEYSLPGMEYFQTARQLIGHGTIFFNPPLRWGDANFETANLGIGMTLVYLPALVPWRILRPDLFATNFFNPKLAYDNRYIVNDLYQYASWTNPLITALACAILFFVCRRQGLSARWSALAALVCGIASPMAPYAKYDYSQPLMGLALIGSLWLLLRGLDKGGIGNWLGAGLFLAFGISARFELILVVPLYALILLWYPTFTLALPIHWREKIRPIVLFAAGAGLGVVTYLLVNYVRYGSPFDFGYADTFGSHSGIIGIVGNMVSPGRGLVVFFPVALLSFVGLGQRVMRLNIVAISLAILMLGYYILYSGVWIGWFSGWAWGPRYMIPFMPFLSMYAVMWLANQKFVWNRRSVLFAGLVAVSWVITLNGILFDFLDYYSKLYTHVVADAVMGTEHLTLEASPLFTGWDWSHGLEGLDLYWINPTRSVINFTHWFGLGVLLAIFAAAVIALARWLDVLPQEIGSDAPNVQTQPS